MEPAVPYYESDMSVGADGALAEDRPLRSTPGVLDPRLRFGEISLRVRKAGEGRLSSQASSSQMSIRPPREKAFGQPKASISKELRNLLEGTA